MKIKKGYAKTLKENIFKIGFNLCKWMKILSKIIIKGRILRRIE